MNEEKFIINGVCRNDGKYICEIGYACDGCPYNKTVELVKDVNISR